MPQIAEGSETREEKTFYFTMNFSLLANKALLIVCNCDDITLNTDKSIRLNSSKQPQAPVYG